MKLWGRRPFFFGLHFRIRGKSKKFEMKTRVCENFWTEGLFVFFTSSPFLFDPHRPGAPGGIPGPCPPKWLLVPPKRKLSPPSEDCAPKKLTGSGLRECKSSPKLVFFVDWQRISWRFFCIALVFGRKTAWISDFGRKIPRKIDEDLFFFLRSPVFGRKYRLNFRFRQEHSFQS